MLEWASKNNRDIVFEIVNLSKQESNLNFKAMVKLDGEEIGEGMGNNKKSAEQHAADNACQYLELLE